MKQVRIDSGDLDIAVRVIKAFVESYPDKVSAGAGIQHCVIFSVKEKSQRVRCVLPVQSDYVVYATPTQIVCRRDDAAAEKPWSDGNWGQIL